MKPTPSRAALASRERSVYHDSFGAAHRQFVSPPNQNRCIFFLISTEPFDLDGTLTDSLPGIGRCINYALAELGRDQVPEAQFRSAVGMPLDTIFWMLLETSDTDLIDGAVAAYRGRFDRIGIFENSLYPGIVEALELFHRWGRSLGVVTVKPAPAARRVVLYFGIHDFFSAIHGPDLLDRTGAKADLLQVALNGRDRAAVMVGWPL